MTLAIEVCFVHCKDDSPCRNSYGANVGKRYISTI